MGNEYLPDDDLDEFLSQRAQPCRKSHFVAQMQLMHRASTWRGGRSISSPRRLSVRAYRGPVGCTW